MRSFNELEPPELIKKINILIIISIMVGWVQLQNSKVVMLLKRFINYISVLIRAHKGKVLQKDRETFPTPSTRPCLFLLFPGRGREFPEH